MFKGAGCKQKAHECIACKGLMVCVSLHIVLLPPLHLHIHPPLLRPPPPLSFPSLSPLLPHLPQRAIIPTAWPATLMLPSRARLYIFTQPTAHPILTCILIFTRPKQIPSQFKLRMLAANIVIKLNWFFSLPCLSYIGLNALHACLPNCPNVFFGH